MRVGKLLGIDIELDWSWLVALVVLAWYFSGPEGPFISFDPRLRVGIAVVVVVLIFASVLFHELAHVVIARRCGLSVDGIKLFLFGGVSRTTGSIGSRRNEVLIAAAGPLATGAVAALLFAGSLQMPQPAQSMVLYVAYANALLAVLNLLPAYPLDGGRVVHAASWAISGDRDSATRSTIAMSRGVGVACMVCAVLLVLSGLTISAIWVALLAWFVLEASRMEWLREIVLRPLGDVRVADIVDPVPTLFQPHTSCGYARAIMCSKRERAALVADEQRVVGLVTFADVSRCTSAEIGSSVDSCMTPRERLTVLSEDASALVAFELLAKSGHRQVPVMRDGACIGLITQQTMARVIGFERERSALTNERERYSLADHRRPSLR